MENRIELIYPKTTSYVQLGVGAIFVFAANPELALVKTNNGSVYLTRCEIGDFADVEDEDQVYHVRNSAITRFCEGIEK